MKIPTRDISGWLYLPHFGVENILASCFFGETVMPSQWGLFRKTANLRESYEVGNRTIPNLSRIKEELSQIYLKRRLREVYVNRKCPLDIHVPVITRHTGAPR